MGHLGLEGWVPDVALQLTLRGALGNFPFLGLGFLICNLEIVFPPWQCVRIRWKNVHNWSSTGPGAVNAPCMDSKAFSNKLRIMRPALRTSLLQRMRTCLKQAL